MKPITMAASVSIVAALALSGCAGAGAKSLPMCNASELKAALLANHYQVNKMSATSAGGLKFPLADLVKSRSDAKCEAAFVMVSTSGSKDHGQVVEFKGSTTTVNKSVSSAAKSHGWVLLPEEYPPFNAWSDPRDHSQIVLTGETAGGGTIVMVNAGN